MDSEVCSIDRTRCNLDLYLYITISEHFACDRAWREFSDFDLSYTRHSRLQKNNSNVFGPVSKVSFASYGHR